MRADHAGFGMARAALQRQRGDLLCFAPVFLGFGVAGFFSLKTEPGVEAFVAASVIAGCSISVARLLRHSIGPLFAAAALVAIGFCLAGTRTYLVAGPVLDYRYYGVIEGRVVHIDRSASDKIRLTLDRVYLERMDAWEIPQRVRVALHGQDELPVPLPGAHVAVTGHLSGPPSPAEPYGFDFERHAFFQRLGAVGYSRSPAVTVGPPERGLKLAVFRLRMKMSAALQARIRGESGAVAAAITTGDRSGMGQDVITDLRRSNLAHLLAISGLHMGLLTGFVFAIVRFGLALVPYSALHWPTRKIAAAAALIVGAGYLTLSGGAVATERAYIMAAVVFGAVLLGRRALTLRAVALAAVMILVLQPEALLGPGFQMSFAATTALVAAFRLISERDMFGLPRWLRPVAAVVLSSAIAGAATAPFAAAHFNIFSSYGLIANLLSVPIMGAIVMPSAVIGGVLSLVGLSAPAFWVMEQGLKWILFVADKVSSLDGAVARVHAPGPEVLPLIAVGGLFLILWRGVGRWTGIAPIALAFTLWTQADRPGLLISPTGGLVGVMHPEGRAMSKPRGDGFVAGVWLENDGDGAPQEVAYARGNGASIVFGGQKFLHLTGKAARGASCSGSAILILNDTPDTPLTCASYIPTKLRKTGALAYFEQGQGLRRVTTREVTGQRLWNDKRIRARFGIGQKTMYGAVGS